MVIKNIKKRLSHIKNVKVCWIDSCTYCTNWPGKLFNIEYKCKGKVMKYLRVNPEFLNLYLRKVV